MEINHALSRRSDLSTFVVHLTRDYKTSSAKDQLKSIINSHSIEARSMLGHAKKTLEKRGKQLDSQKCVCFTETPLEYIYLLCEEINNREVQYKPYGIAITKKVARQNGINPVWYLDISPTGRDWLTKPFNDLIEEALRKNRFEGSPVAKLAPFIEQMGTKYKDDGNLEYRKEFWWEREWRHQGNFALPRHVIVLCPEAEHDEFRSVITSSDQSATTIDPLWGLEQIIANLAGFKKDEIEIL